MKFEENERVVCTSIVNRANLSGWKGTVISIGPGRTLAIQFDKEMTKLNCGRKGHTCNDRGKPGHCWWVNVTDLKKVKRKEHSGWFV